MQDSSKCRLCEEREREREREREKDETVKTIIWSRRSTRASMTG